VSYENGIIEVTSNNGKVTTTRPDGVVIVKTIVSSEDENTNGNIIYELSAGDQSSKITTTLSGIRTELNWDGTTTVTIDGVSTTTDANDNVISPYPVIVILEDPETCKNVKDINWTETNYTFRHHVKVLDNTRIVGYFNRNLSHH